MQNEIEQLKKVFSWVKSVWAQSLGIVLSLLIGFGLGVLHTEGKIIDDCRYSSVFRIGLQAYNCQRRN